MRSTFKLGLVIGVVSLVASSMPACGGDSSSDDGNKKTGGTGGKDGGAGTGGYGATGGAVGGGGSGGATGGSGGGGTGGSGGGVTTITCKAESCTGYSVAGFAIDPCCAGADKDKCGVDINQQIADTIGIKPGCFELNQAGKDDNDCPPLTGVPVIGTLPSCCNTAKSQCSFKADLSGLGGPNIGCVDPSNLPPSEAGPPAACDGISSDGGSTGGTGGTEAGTGGTTTDASSD
jgi:hypothetical protein